LINPEDSDGGGYDPKDSGGSGSFHLGGDENLGVAIGALAGALQRPTIRLLRNPAMVTVKSNSTITAASVKKGITVGDVVYINNFGYVTTEKPDDLAPIIGVVTDVDNNDIELSVEPGIAIAYDHVVEHTGGMITEGEYFDPKKTIAYSDEDRQSEKLRTTKKIASKKGGKRKGGETKTTIDEDLMNALLED